MKIFITSSAATVQVRRKRALEDTAACVGPGSQICIRPAPRAERGEAGLGSCEALTPPADLFAEFRAGWIELEVFKARYVAQLRANFKRLAPETLIYTGTGGAAFLVWKGDTLTCSCGKKAAAEGKCHRTWAAAALRLSGWEVILDGEDLSESSAQALLK